MTNFDRIDDGVLCMVWHQNQAPEPDAHAVMDLYEDRFRPTLEKDVLRLYAVFAASISRTGQLSYADYYEATLNLKKSVGAMALHDMDALEAELDGMHARYLQKSFYSMQGEYRELTSRLHGRSDTADDGEFLDRRFRCIAFNTYEALRDVSSRLRNTEYQAELYIKSLIGPGEVERLITKDWLDDRRNEDLDILRNGLRLAMGQKSIIERARMVEEAHHTTPAQSDSEVMMRQAEILQRNSHLRHRAA